MGFLLGAYGKLMAGKRVRNLQSRMVQVQQRSARITRQVGDMEKSLNRQEQMMNQQMRMMQMPLQYQMQMAGYGATLDTTQRTRLWDMQQLMYKSQANLSFYFESLREQMLQPLKDQEESLEVEKANLESQLQLARQDYEAQKEMEKQGAKDIAPNYTGQN